MVKKLLLSCGLILGATTISMANAGNKPITKEEIIAFETKWGKSIVAIGDEYQKHGNYKLIASKVIDEMYAYNDGGVLFKPTKASEDQFRESKKM